MNVFQWVRSQWDRVGGWLLICVGGLAIVFGWVGVRSEALTAKQIPFVISGGIGGLFLLGVGATLWLSADLRDAWRKLDDLDEPERALVPSGEVRVEAVAAPQRVSSNGRRRRAPLERAPSSSS